MHIVLSCRWTANQGSSSSQQLQLFCSFSMFSWPSYVLLASVTQVTLHSLPSFGILCSSTFIISLALNVTGLIFLLFVNILQYWFYMPRLGSWPLQSNLRKMEIEGSTKDEDLANQLKAVVILYIMLLRCGGGLFRVIG